VAASLRGWDQVRDIEVRDGMPASVKIDDTFVFTIAVQNTAATRSCCTSLMPTKTALKELPSSKRALPLSELDRAMSTVVATIARHFSLPLALSNPTQAEAVMRLTKSDLRRASTLLAITSPLIAMFCACASHAPIPS